MRPKSLALLLLALGCGLVASIGITEVLAKRSAGPAGPTGETQPIFVAMTDIGLGDLLTPEVLKLEQWPKDKVPQGAISRIEDIEGRRVRTKLYAGEPILENRLLGKGASEQGATALIPKGYRVVPVKVDLVSGGSSLILPGDRVDVMVYLIRDMSRGIPETVTRTILQDIKVFAVNDVVDLEHKDESGRSITAKTISLLVTPEQAAKLMLATQMGTINLVMRSPEDDEQIADAQARPGELFSGKNKSTRDKESLLPEDSSLDEEKKGFLNFLNTVKGKSSTDAATSGQAKSRETWIMRLLKPGEIENVEFEAEEENSTHNSPIGAWKTTSIAAGPGSDKPTDKKPTTVIVPPDPDAIEEPAMEPLQPKQEPKRNNVHSE